MNPKTKLDKKEFHFDELSDQGKAIFRPYNLQTYE